MLKNEGLLVFSYHHSREDGWTSVAAAVLNAGFKLVQTQPVKAEMLVAIPKLAAKSHSHEETWLLRCLPQEWAIL